MVHVYTYLKTFCSDLQQERPWRNKNCLLCAALNVRVTRPSSAWTIFFYLNFFFRRFILLLMKINLNGRWQRFQIQCYSLVEYPNVILCDARQINTNVIEWKDQTNTPSKKEKRGEWIILFFRKITRISENQDIWINKATPNLGLKRVRIQVESYMNIYAWIIQSAKA